MKTFHLFISTAEISGDHHGAQIVRTLKELYPNQFRFSGLGGKEMRSLGVEILCDLSTQSSVGLQEGIRFVKSSFRVLKQTKEWIKNNSVDLFLAIDGQGRNLPLGKTIQKLGIKTAYFFPPLVFLWGSWNTPKLKKYDLLLCPFEPNAKFLSNKGANAVFTGHPFSTYSKTINKKKAKGDLSIDPKKKVLALFPGSRYQEIEKLTNIFLKTAVKLKSQNENLDIFLSLSHEHYRKFIENEISKTGAKVKVVIGLAEKLLTAADFLLAASGTTTLQAAFHYLPTAIAYRVSPLTTLLAKIFLKGNFFGMPNILAGREIYKEFLNNDCSPERLATYIENILFNDYNYQKVVEESKKITDKIRVEHHRALLGEAIYRLIK